MASDPLEGYFAEAATWDRERLVLAQRAQRRAWQVALGGWLCAVGSSAALALLMPLKRVEPFLVRVDRSSGIVDVVPALQGSVPLETGVTRYFLSHYVQTCERFNFASAESDYEECGSFHAAQRNQAWYALWNPHNPASPLNLHKDGSSVHVEVQAVSFFRRASGLTDLAQVRYRKAVRAAGAVADAQVTHWVATIQYAYGTPPTEPRVRRWNPLGFKVLEFVSEPEAAPPEPAG
ncbi:MAG: type IV secretion system protein [Gammaproteobacteria bacterium]|nr:type IV secretion system protein [Gammaproteobacteria bacterium]